MTYQNPYDAGEEAGRTAGRKDRSGYVIHKVVQALSLLEQFHDEVDELSLTELSKRLALNEKNVAMLAATLQSRNYLEQKGHTDKFRLGFKTLELSQTLLRQTDIYRVSHPVLAEVAAACGETTAIAVLRKSLIVELDAVQCELPVQVVPRVGVHLPAHCTAAGKVLLACGTDRALVSLLQEGPLERYTPNTIVDPDKLRRHLRTVQDAGYAVDDGELDLEVCSAAAAIFDYDGRAVGALVITGPSCRVTPDRLLAELIPLVQKGAKEISARLGYHEPSDTAATGESVVRRSASPRSGVRKRASTGTPRAA